VNKIEIQAVARVVEAHYAAGIPVLFLAGRDPTAIVREVTFATADSFQIWRYGVARPSQFRYLERVPQGFVPPAPQRWDLLAAAVTGVTWPDPTVAVLTGLDWSHPDLGEVFRVLAESIKSQHTNATVVLVGTEAPGPACAGVGPVLHVAPPNPPARLWHLQQVFKRNPTLGAPDPALLDAVGEAVAGLEGGEIEQIVQLQLAVQGQLDPAAAAQEKAQRLASGGLLEIMAPDPAGLAGVGGLDGLKTWLTARREAYTPEATAFGLPQPKGVLLVGPPGTGKSLAARAVASTWGFPLVRLDIGRLHGSYVGESEKNPRTVLSQIDGLAPAVVWVDEIEKGLAGSSGQGGGEIARRMLQSLLTWMQEQVGSFLFATANEVSALPPELMRKGRLDEFFWVDLPTEAERAQILAIHLRKRRRDPAGFDLAALAAQAKGFSGSELEAAIIDGLHRAWADRRDLTTEDVAAALAETKPLSQLFPEQISAVRQWGGTHARPAGQDPRQVPMGSQVARLQA
jgi:hypothetical protein